MLLRWWVLGKIVFCFNKKKGKEETVVVWLLLRSIDCILYILEFARRGFNLEKLVNLGIFSFCFKKGVEFICRIYFIILWR